MRTAVSPAVFICSYEGNGYLEMPEEKWEEKNNLYYIKLLHF